MGKTSKFSFPYPGRKRAPAKTKSSIELPPVPGARISKAQRILGAGGDLNIEPPIREESGSQRIHRPLSGMSIDISDSSQDDESVTAANDHVNWDGVLPGQELNRKAPSTLPGRRYYDEAATDASSLDQKLNPEKSSPILRSYYNRQKTPLSVSQQTSASSARDLALRKGLPPVVAFPQSEGASLSAKDTCGGVMQTKQSPAFQSSKKKPSRLDLSRIFPKPRKDEAALPGMDTKHLPSAAPPAPNYVRPSYRCGTRKLVQAESKGKRQSGKTIRGEDQVKRRPRLDAPDGGKNARDQRTALGSHAGETLPRHRSHDGEHPSDGHLKHSRHQWSHASSPKNISREGELSGSQRCSESHGSACDRKIPWKNTSGGPSSPPWGARSFASLSSLNTKRSRCTSASVFSNSDLKNNSVLSLSSDEDSDGETNPRITDQQISPHVDQMATPRSSTKSHDRSQKINVNTPTGISPIQDDNFLTIPPPSPAGSRLSGPWNLRSSSDGRHGTAYCPRDSVITLESRQPSPHSSTSSIQSRLMAVTKQEEALLEALRQKRARMKEKIIAEHETQKSPPQAPHYRHEVRDSKSSALTIKAEKPNGKERILLYLDKSISDGHQIDTAEPSPDLSDFLSFGSDEDDINSTPRTSWLVPKDHGRPDSTIHPDGRGSPITLKSAARLSAVGALGGFMKVGREGDPKKGHNATTGVTFLGSVKSGAEEFLDDGDAVWGV